MTIGRSSLKMQPLLCTKVFYVLSFLNLTNYHCKEMGMYFNQGSDACQQRLFNLTSLSISGLYYKSFMSIIYDHNDCSQYYNTMITIVSYAPNLTLGLARVVNYDRK